MDDWTDGVHFGWVGVPPPDPTEPFDDPDPDDEELPETPADVVSILGSDPKVAFAEPDGEPERG